MCGLLLSIACALTCAGCAKYDPPPPASPSPKKQRTEILVWLTPAERQPLSDPLSVTLSTAKLPETPELIERGGVVLGIIGLPREFDLPKGVSLLSQNIAETHPRVDAMIVLTTYCLEDLQPAVTTNLQYWWKLALVVGEKCGGHATSPVGVTALVEAGRTTPIRLTFDRTTHAILKLE